MAISSSRSTSDTHARLPKWSFLCHRQEHSRFGVDSSAAEQWCILESKAYAVRSFGSAAGFLEAAPSLPVGCLIVDIRMPEMDGLGLQQHLADRSLDFPLIVITPRGDVPLAVRAMRAGAVDFIEKPFASQAILDSLEVALSRLTTANEEDLAKAREACATLIARASGVGGSAGRPAQLIDCVRFGDQPRTVEIHRAPVMDKMGARSLSELIRLALARAAGVQLNSH